MRGNIQDVALSSISNENNFIIIQIYIITKLFL